MEAETINDWMPLVPLINGEGQGCFRILAFQKIGGGIFLDALSRARRVGLTAVACAALLRLSATEIPKKMVDSFLKPHIAQFLTYLETGHKVRFSASLEGFSPWFVESPAPSLPAPTEPAAPESPQIEVFYSCDVRADLDALLEQPLKLELYGQGPAVLILHTHGTESYTRTDEPYVESAAWRTLEEDYNMLSIGAHLARLLEKAGIGVIQDRTLHDYPSYNGSYVHARKAIRDYLKEYPTIRLILDLHRDASGGEAQLRTLARVEGQDSAQLMVVLGTNHGSYEENLSLGLKLHAQLEAQTPGITRPLQLRSQRFNQDLYPHSLLIEVGAAGNTHDEALVAAEQLAKAIRALAGS